MAAIERAVAQADQRARRLLLEIGREIHITRVNRGLSQAAVARAAGFSQPLLSLIERGADPGVSIGTLSRACAVVGRDLSVRAYPGGSPLRDGAHVALLERFRRAVGPRWSSAAEVPLPIPGDKRAWDRVIRAAGVIIGIEGETRPTDMQELARRLALKKRDGGVDRLVLVLSDTEWCRRLMRLNDVDQAFPVPGKVALKALAEGRDPGGDAVVLV